MNRATFVLSLVGRIITPVCLLGLAVIAASPASAQTPVELHDGLRYTPGQANPPPANRRRKIRLEIPPGYIDANGEGVSWGPVQRSPTNSNFPLGITGIYEDSDWAYDTTYTYTRQGTRFYRVWNQTTQAWEIKGEPISTSVPVTVRRVVATATQTVDTRIDPRYSTYVVKDYQFGTSLYRGGLFAGFNADGSKVARTYLKFSNLPGPLTAGERLWAAGGMSVYFTRSARPDQTATVKANFVADDSWNPATLKWSNAPTFDDDGTAGIALPWAAGSPGRWVSFGALPGLSQSLTQNGGDGTLSVALSVANESNGGMSATFPMQAASGWAYFARAGYTQDGLTDLEPYFLYAFGGNGLGASLTVSVNIPIPPTTTPPTLRKLYSNTTTTGRVGLTSPAPAGGVTVNLVSGSSSQVTVPASVTIPPGSYSANFAVTAGTIPASGTVTISAKLSTAAPGDAPVIASVPVAP